MRAPSISFSSKLQLMTAFTWVTRQNLKVKWEFWHLIRRPVESTVKSSRNSIYSRMFDWNITVCEPKGGCRSVSPTRFDSRSPRNHPYGAHTQKSYFQEKLKNRTPEALAIYGKTGLTCRYTVSKNSQNSSSEKSIVRQLYYYIDRSSQVHAGCCFARDLLRENWKYPITHIFFSSTFLCIFRVILSRKWTS